MNCFKVLLGVTLLVSSGHIIASEEHPGSVEQNRAELDTILRWSHENQQTIDRVRQLLQQDVGDINEVIIDVTPLELAVIRLAPEWCRLLIQAGAQVNNPRLNRSLGHLLTSYEGSPFLAANRDNFDRGCAVMNLLIQNGYNINTQDQSGDTPFAALYFSCLGGGTTREAAEYFLNHGADITIPSINHGGVRLIDYVQGNGPVNRAMRAFLAQRDLIQSILHNDTAGIKNALLRGARVGRQDAQGNNAFHIAAGHITDQDSARVFMYLLSLPITNIGSYLQRQNHAGETPIHIMVFRGTYAILEDGLRAMGLK